MDVRAVETEGALDKDTVRPLVSSSLDRVRSCVFDDQSLAIGSSANVLAFFRIDKSGRVVDVKIDHAPEGSKKTDLGPPRGGFEICAASALRSAQFSTAHATTEAATLIHIRVQEPPRLAPPKCTYVEGLETGRVVVENRTGDTISFTWAGAASGSVSIGPGRDLERDLPEGSYRFAVRDAVDTDVSPAFMQKTLVNGYLCGWTMTIVTTTRDAAR